MPKGRRPLPSAVKNLRGNPGKRKSNDSEPHVPGTPKMPEGLSEAAQQEWRTMLPHLIVMGVVSPVDATALSIYCATYDMWLQAMADVKKYGIQLRDPIFGRKGTPEENVIIDHDTKKNPATPIAFEAKKILKSYLSEFGCTPASRSKLHVEKPKTVDPADIYFNKKLAGTSAVN